MFFARLNSNVHIAGHFGKGSQRGQGAHQGRSQSTNQSFNQPIDLGNHLDHFTTKFFNQPFNPIHAFIKATSITPRHPPTVPGQVLRPLLPKPTLLNKDLLELPLRVKQVTRIGATADKVAVWVPDYHCVSCHCRLRRCGFYCYSL